MQTTFRQTAVVHITQTMHGLRKSYRTTVQLRKEILQLRSIRMQIRQVRTQVRVRQILQTDSRHIAVQDLLSVIAQTQSRHCQRIHRTADRTLQSQHTLETVQTRHEQRYIRRRQLRADIERCLQSRRIHRHTHRYAAQGQVRVRQTRHKDRHIQRTIRQHYARLHVFDDEGRRV